MTCARYFGSDGTMCASHHGRFPAPTDSRCDRADAERATRAPSPDAPGQNPRVVLGLDKEAAERLAALAFDPAYKALLDENDALRAALAASGDTPMGGLDVERPVSLRFLDLIRDVNFAQIVHEARGGKPPVFIGDEPCYPKCGDLADRILAGTMAALSRREYATLDAERATRATTLPVDLAGALARAQHTVNLQVGGCDHSGGVGDCEDTVRELLRLAAIHSTPAPEIDVEALARALVKVFGPANGAYGGVQAQRDAADIAAEYARQRKGTPQEDAS